MTATDLLATDPSIRAIARWTDEYGTTYEWPQVTVDNRRARVLHRIALFQFPPFDPATLTIEHV